MTLACYGALEIVGVIIIIIIIRGRSFSGHIVHVCVCAVNEFSQSDLHKIFTYRASSLSTVQLK